MTKKVVTVNSIVLPNLSQLFPLTINIEINLVKFENYKKHFYLLTYIKNI